MLSRLTISNYALIRHLDFIPDAGLSIITGETGAGKSVMLGALSLLKGGRADMKVIADKGKKAVVEAEFRNLDKATSMKVCEITPDIDGEELIIRREIYPSGRSRAFVNDSPATLTQLEAITKDLLDIHSQNSNSLLAEPSTQLMLIDSVAHNEDALRAYSEKFRDYVDLRLEIRKLKENTLKNKAREDIITFRLAQLDKLKPKSGELARIEAKYDVLSNSEALREALAKARRLLEGSDGQGAIDLIDEATGVIGDVDFSIWEEEDPEVCERLRQCAVEIKDICETIEGAIGQTESDPASMAALSSRMNEYYSAFKNFKVATDTDLEDLHLSLVKEYRSLEGNDEKTGELEKEAKKIAVELKKLASDISLRRKEGAMELEKEIETEARKLGLDNLKFEIELTEGKLSKTGGDNVEFLASFNKNSILAPVGQIASGGETARLMLAIKKITSSRLNMPTVIFDEIDTGVSGNIADRMGEMMNEMGRKMQILTITHLPQVAVKGDMHFKVYKEDCGETTVSNVRLLTQEEREEEIGRMLSGEKLDEAALSNARSLLKKR